MTSREEFVRLLDTRRDVVWTIASAYGSDARSREEVAREIAVRLWRSLPGYDARTDFATWAYPLALDAAIASDRAPSQPLDPLERALLVLHLAGRTAAESAPMLGLSPEDADAKLARVQRRLARRGGVPAADGSAPPRLTATAAEGVERAQTRLERRRLAWTFEAALAGLGAYAAASFAAEHAADPRFAIAALVAGGMLATLAVAIVLLIVRVAPVEANAPVAVVAARLERLRVANRRVAAWTLRLAPLLLVPAAIVASQWIFGVDLYRARGALIATAALALACVPLAFAAARRLRAP